MKKVIAIIVFCAVAFAALCEEAYDDNAPIQVDWYPLLTDSVGWNIYSGGVMVGWVNAPSAPAGMDVNMGRSMELAWLTVVGAKYNTGHGQRITMGVGIDWRNYRLQGDTYFLPVDGGLALSPYAAGMSPVRSRVKVFSLTAPVLLHQRIAKHTDIFVGPVVCFNVHASALTIYDVAGERTRLTSNHIHPVPVTVDVLAGVKWRCFGAYVRYSPCHVLQADHAPAFRSFSAGIYIGI
ncbi:MAG: hypothetical protein II428_02530 [Muribaculaceae bacterium]|nr:hypothetical protein [Muribaculaceae bacterium]MBQ1798816.1 hypothetical protein [Muribaculaceae bacterium]MBQ2235577.1 hypothetical protein [Muribaculaceae bacterium]MBQ4006194.1 hypothetical protein [Muribaculaceae bacterium]